MSSIDKRIVQMQFDNQGFEQGVSKTMKSLDKLNESLKMKNANTGLTEVGKGVNSLTNLGIGALGQGVDAVASKFNAMGIIAATALVNITNKAMEVGSRISKALTIEPITTGFSEYETKMNSIQTILTNTASKGTTLEDVTAVLDELNRYADQTIYNFAEMTRNIGTFTAAGVDLETSALAIKGIANLAAGSGSSAQQASTAMYQLSQALAAGKVGLQDWNSVVNAGMGGELFQNALKEQAKAMGVFVDESKPFRETLQDGWLTTDVLVATLEKFANDPSLVKAATEVKTLTQMLDTMKESVQSGWSTSWEHIIGDKEEAAALFTSISDGFNKIIAPSTNARNGMLKFWNEYGGREAVIEGLTNVMTSLGKVMNGLSMAWEMVFPPMTGKKLVELSEGFRDLTEKFKITDQTAGKIGAVFKGLLDTLVMGKDAVVGFVKGLSPLKKVFDGMGTAMLDVVSNIGKFLSGLKESANKINIFETMSSNMEKAVSGVSDFILNLKDNVAKMIGYLGSLDFSGFFKNIASGFKGIGDLLSPVFEQIGNVIGSINFDTLFGLVKAGSAIEIVKSLRGMFEEVSGTAENVGGMFNTIKKAFNSFSEIGGKVAETLESVKETLVAYVRDVNARMLLKIASAVAILSGALLLMASIDEAGIKRALAGMSVIMIELGAAYVLLTKAGAIPGLVFLGGFLQKFAIGVFILALALKQLSGIKQEDLASGIVGLTAAIGGMIVGAKTLSKSSGKMFSGAVAITVFAASLHILVSAIEKLGSIDAEVMGQGLVALGILLGEIALFMMGAKFGKFGITSATGILILANALLVLQKGVEAFGAMDPDSIIRGLAAVAGILAEIALFSKFGGNGFNMAVLGVGLNLMSSALAELSDVMKSMGSMKWDEIGRGLTAMAGGLLILGTASKLISGPQMVLLSVGIGAMSAALMLLGVALDGFGTMTWEEIGKGLLVLAGALTILGVAMYAMSGAIVGAAALVIVAGAIALLTPQLMLLSSMSLEGVGIALLAMAGAFTVLGLAGLLLTPVVPTLIALAAAIALIGVGAIACGAGLSLVGTGLGLVGVAIGGSGLLIVEFLKQLINLLPDLGKKAAEGIINFVKVITDNVPVLVAGFAAIISALVQAIAQLVPEIADAAIDIIVALVEGLAEGIPEMVDAGLELVTGVLRGIADNIEGLVQAGMDIAINFMDGVASRIGEIIESGINLALSFIEGIADGLTNNKERMSEAIRKVIKAMLTTGVEVITGGIKGFIEGGSELLQGLIDGVKKMWPKVKEAVKSAIDKAKTAALEKINSLYQAGKDLVQGFIDGISSMISNVGSAASSIAARAKDSVLSFLGINSPSRVFMEIGRYTAEGLAVGLEKYSSKVVGPSEDMARSVVDSVEKPLSKLDSLLGSDLNANPVITPVMDLSNVEAGAKRLGSMIGNSNMRIGGASMRLAGTVGTIQNGNGNAEVISALKDLKDGLNGSNTNNYTINGITYDDGSNMASAIETLVRAARIERRI